MSHKSLYLKFGKQTHAFWYPARNDNITNLADSRAFHSDSLVVHLRVLDCALLQQCHDLGHGKLRGQDAEMVIMADPLDSNLHRKARPSPRPTLEVLKDDLERFIRRSSEIFPRL